MKLQLSSCLCYYCLFVVCMFVCLEPVGFGAWRAHHKDNSRGGRGDYPATLLQLSVAADTTCRVVQVSEQSVDRGEARLWWCNCESACGCWCCCGGGQRHWRWRTASVAGRRLTMRFTVPNLRKIPHAKNLWKLAILWHLFKMGATFLGWGENSVCGCQRENMILVSALPVTSL